MPGRHFLDAEIRSIHEAATPDDDGEPRDPR
jgi:hypothetical protein